tara:strand:+ start:2280 stop:2663 length:384 start_codon:yes stop_codon:yes gene_type:complete
MIEVVIGIVILLFVLLGVFEGYISRSRIIKGLEKETNDVKENLNHLAGAIISLSEILDDADEVIENISKVPTVGEMIQQALVGFISQKMQNVLPEPMIEPMEQVISEKFVQPTYGEAKTLNEEENEN